MNYKNICKEVSEENNINLNVLISLNFFIFKEVSDWTRNPESLRTYLKHFGSWFFKKKKTEDKLRILDAVVAKNQYYSDKNKEAVLNKIKNYNFILSEYENYIEERYIIKCKKYGKEAYEAFCLAKKQEKLQKTKKDKLI